MHTLLTKLELVQVTSPFIGSVWPGRQVILMQVGAGLLQAPNSSPGVSSSPQVEVEDPRKKNPSLHEKLENMFRLTYAHA